jgi:hypothetical protein
MQDESALTPEAVIANDEAPALAVPVKQSQGRGAPKWESDARERLKGAIKKFSKPLADLLARDANEGDTRLLVTDFLCEGLGFDKYNELTTEYRVKGEFADFGIRMDKEMIAFIEVKRVNTKLGVKHLRQVESYAVNEGVEWIMLTNGAEWQVYHITGGLPIIVDLAFEVNILDDSNLSAKSNQLFYITRDALLTAFGKQKEQLHQLHSRKFCALTVFQTRFARNSNDRRTSRLAMRK